MGINEWILDFEGRSPIWESWSLIFFLIFWGSFGARGMLATHLLTNQRECVEKCALKGVLLAFLFGAIWSSIPKTGFLLRTTNNDLKQKDES